MAQAAEAERDGPDTVEAQLRSDEWQRRLDEARRLRERRLAASGPPPPPIRRLSAGDTAQPAPPSPPALVKHRPATPLRPAPSELPAPRPAGEAPPRETRPIMWSAVLAMVLAIGFAGGAQWASIRPDAATLATPVAVTIPPRPTAVRPTRTGVPTVAGVGPSAAAPTPLAPARPGRTAAALPSLEAPAPAGWSKPEEAPVPLPAVSNEAPPEVLATAAATAAPPPAASAVEAEPDGPATVYLHVPSDASGLRLGPVMSRIEGAGFPLVGPIGVGFAVGTDHVRYFHQADAPAARAVAEALGAVTRDFTSFRPSPDRGTVEVWLSTQG